MKKFGLFSFLLLVMFFVSCKKKNSFHTDTLLGIDYRECASPYCGGWFIEIGRDTFRFIEIPPKSNIDLNGPLKFPVKVNAVWHRYYNHWSDVPDLIYVTELWKK